MTVIDMETRLARVEASPIPDTAHETIQLYVMNQIEKEGPVVFAEGHWWQCAKFGAWVPMQEERIWNEVRALNGVATLEGGTAQKPGKPIRVNAGMCASVSLLARAAYAKPDAFHNPTHGFVSPAGLWTCDETGWSPRPPKPEDMVRMWQPVDPDLDATPVEWERALSKVWGHEEDYEQRFAFLHEWMANMLIGEAHLHAVAIILVGHGHNGKSVIIDGVAELVPSELRCSITPAELENNRFASAGLVGKALNHAAEIPSGDLMESAKIKSVIDGSQQTGEHKNEKAFLFTPVAASIYGANQLPRFKDLSYGFMRRWAPLSCTAEIPNDETKILGYGKILVQRERAQILGYAMRYHSARIRAKRVKYTAVPSVEELKLGWRADSDSVQQFVEEACAAPKDGKGGSTITFLYSTYAKWCGRNGLKAVGSKTFAQRLDLLKIESFKHGVESTKLRPIVVTWSEHA